MNRDAISEWVNIKSTRHTPLWKISSSHEIENAQKMVKDSSKKNKWEVKTSIVVLSLLRQFQTERCIKTVLKHTDDFEIVVIDMGKSQETIAWLKELSAKHRNIKVIFNKDNVGTTRGRNQGIRSSSGKYVVFLDNDVEVTENWLNPLITEIEGGRNVGACGSKAVSKKGVVSRCGSQIRPAPEDHTLTEIGFEFTERLETGDPEVNRIMEVSWYPTTCFLTKREILEKVGGFDEKLFMCEEDKDLSLSIRKEGLNILYVPQSCVYHNHHPSSAYDKIRKDPMAIVRDIKYFKQKWGCNVFIKIAKSFLKECEFETEEIDKLKAQAIFTTIIEDELTLRELILTVTGRCNHTCGMCYYHASLNRKNSELTLDEYSKLSLSLGQMDHLWISGGEPFLRDDLPDICRLFSENNSLKSVFIPTNGSFPKKVVSTVEKIMEILPAIKLQIMLSLEGLQSTHDRIHGKAGAFNSTVETIKRLGLLRLRLIKKNRNFSLLLNTVVTTENFREVVPVMEYVKNNLVVDFHAFSPMRGAGKDISHQPPGGKVLYDLFCQAQPYFEFYAGRGRASQEKSNETQRWLDRRYGLWRDILDGGIMPFTCQAGRLIGVLEPNGDVRLCELKPVVGNVRKAGYDFKKVWFSDEAERLRANVKGCSCTHACFISISEKQGVERAHAI